MGSSNMRKAFREWLTEWIWHNMWPRIWKLYCRVWANNISNLCIADNKELRCSKLVGSNSQLLGNTYSSLVFEGFYNRIAYYKSREALFYALKMLLLYLGNVSTTGISQLYVFWSFQDCVSEALLARLFDPVVSPRCYAIIAIKK